MNRFRMLVSLLALLALLAAACGDDDPVTSPDDDMAEESSEDDSSADEMAEDDGPGTIVDVAVGAGTFETLVAAVKAAGLVETLKSDGPFTVFAPADSAFAKIPGKDLNALVADKKALTSVLTYHVVPGKIMSGDIAGKTAMVETVQGSKLSVDATDGVKVDSATVISADLVDIEPVEPGSVR